MVSTVSVYLLTKNSYVLPHCLIDLSLHTFSCTIHPISSTLCHNGWVSMLLGSSNWLMLGGIMKGSLISISIKNGNQICVGQFGTTNNPVALSAENFSIATYACKWEETTKYFIFPWYRESICYFCKGIWSVQKEP